MYRDDGFILFNGSPDEIKEFFDIGNSCHQYLRFTYETLHQCQFRIVSDYTFAHISNLLTASNTCTGKVLIARQFSRTELEDNVLRNTSDQDALKTIL